MTSIPGSSAAAAAIHAAFGVAVLYTGAGLAGEQVSAVPATPRAGGQQFSTLHARTFEIQRAALPEEPAKEDVIEDAAGARWVVIEIDELEHVDAWLLAVEAA